MQRSTVMVINRGRYEVYVTCPRQYYWLYVRNRQEPVIGMPLRYGSAVHKFLEVWHKLYQLDPAIDALKQDFKRTLNQQSVIPLTLQVEQQIMAEAELLCRKYVERYGTETEYTFINTELQGDAPLANGHSLRFRIDGLVGHDNKLWVAEHKTTRWLGASFIDSFTFNFQVISYVYGSSKVLKQPIAGTLMNFLRKPQANQEAAFHRMLVVTPPSHMRDMLMSFSYIASEIEDKDPTDMYQFPQKTKECGSCQFRNICAFESDPHGASYVPRPQDYVDQELANVTV